MTNLPKLLLIPSKSTMGDNLSHEEFRPYKWKQNKYYKPTRGLEATSFAFKYSSVMLLQKIKTYISTVSGMSISIYSQPAISTEVHWAARQPNSSWERDEVISRRRHGYHSIYSNSIRPVFASLK